MKWDSSMFVEAIRDQNREIRSMSASDYRRERAELERQFDEARKWLEGEARAHKPVRTLSDYESMLRAKLDRERDGLSDQEKRAAEAALEDLVERRRALLRQS